MVEAIVALQVKMVHQALQVQQVLQVLQVQQVLWGYQVHLVKMEHPELQVQLVQAAQVKAELQA